MSSVGHCAAIGAWEDGGRNFPSKGASSSLSLLRGGSTGDPPNMAANRPRLGLAAPHHGRNGELPLPHHAGAGVLQQSSTCPVLLLCLAGQRLILHLLSHEAEAVGPLLTGGHHCGAHPSARRPLFFQSKIRACKTTVRVPFHCGIEYFEREKQSLKIFPMGNLTYPECASYVTAADHLSICSYTIQQKHCIALMLVPPKRQTNCQW